MEGWKNKVVVVLNDLQLYIAAGLAMLFQLYQKYFSFQTDGNDLDSEDPTNWDI